MRDYVHVSDVMEAVIRALDYELWSGPMVIGSGTSISVLEMIEALRLASNARLDVRHGSARPGEMRAVAVDISRETQPGGHHA